jgi:hypothetical protein
MMDHDGAIRDGDLKGAQVRDLTNLMLDDMERLYQAEKGRSTGTGTPAGQSANLPIPESLNSSIPQTNTGTDIGADRGVVELGRNHGEQVKAENLSQDNRSAQAGAEIASDNAGAGKVPELLGWDVPLSNPELLLDRIHILREISKRPWKIPDDWEHLGDKEVPQEAVTHMAPGVGVFKAPPEANFFKVYEDGEASGGDPVRIWRDLGYFGTYDFQRDTAHKRYVKDYRFASNFAVGVYMNAAGFSLARAIQIAEKYGAKVSDDERKKQIACCTSGWYAANSGMFRIQP